MPNNKVLEGKKAIVASYTDKIKSAKAGVVVGYAGITVEQDTALRSAMRKAGVEYKVLKNNITGRACEGAGYSEINSFLTGMTAIAISQEDPIAPAKILKEYAEKIPTFEIKVGFLDGAVVDKATIEALAEIPSKDVLIGKLLGSIQSPLFGLACVLKAIIDKNGEAETAAPAEEAPAAEAPAAE